MKHTRTITREPITAQSTIEVKTDFMVSLITQAGDFFGVALDIATELLRLVLHWPLGTTA